MWLRRSVLIGSVAALATAGVMAVPAGALNSCSSTMAPNIAGGESAFKVACFIDVTGVPATTVGRLTIGDIPSAVWHRGASRTVTVATTATTTITFAPGTLVSPDDLRRPISGTGIAGGAFISTLLPAACTVLCSSATLSKAGTLSAAHAVKIEHSSARVVQDATYGAGATSTLAVTVASFSAADLNKSVSGGSFPPGARISAFTNGTHVVVTPGATLACPALAPGCGTTDTLTIGAAQYTAASPSTVTTYKGTYNREMSKTTNTPAGTASCAGTLLTVTTPGGGINAQDKLLAVKFRNAAAAVAGTWKITATTATTATLSAACPAATWTNVTIGLPGANAPADGSVTSALTASLNLPPSSVPTVDDCAKSTYEGFQIIGQWNNPGAFSLTGVLGAPPDRTIAQILFPTSVISFAGYIMPRATDALQTGDHFNFFFPTLPSSVAVCGLAGQKTAVAFGFFATTLSVPPFLATSSGAPDSPSIRALSAPGGPFSPKVQLATALGVAIGLPLSGTPCTIVASNVAAAATLGCGLG